MLHQLFTATPACRWKLAAACGVVALSLFTIASIDPAGSPLYPRCLFHSLTGLHCPGCGGLRAVHQGLNGRWLTAIKLNALLPLFASVAVYALASDLRVLVGGRALPPVRCSAAAAWAIAVIVLAFWVLRNIPVYPFTLLAP
jgi:hypothetical protein